MHQRSSFDDFNAFESDGPKGSRAKWIFLGSLLAAALAAAAGAGYALGRGTWTVPSSIAASIPAPLSAWLPPPSRPNEATGSPAELTHYAFELVEGQIKRGEAVVEVRLTDKRSGKPVPDAVIFARRLDMAPDGMPTMTAELQPQPATGPGTYRFKTDLMMEGGWQLSLGAKVQGETGTVKNKLVLKAVP